VATGGAEQTHSFFVRVYETVSMHAHERAANSFLRAQAIVDTVTAGKMAAAAASAAALAGGGVAVEGVLSAAPATPQAIVRRADNSAATAFVKAPSKTSTHAKRRPHARPSKSSGTRGLRRTANRSRGATGSGSAVGASSAAQTRAAAPSATSSQPATTAPHAAAASAGSAHGAGTSASSEFGFEGP
jgi:hypothetical protein